MSKKNKNFNNEILEIHNMDTIGYMTDETIHDLVVRFENEKNRLLSINKDAHLCEVELAYLFREQQLRQIRAEKHVEYVQKLGKQANSKEENDYSSTTFVETEEFN